MAITGAILGGLITGFFAVHSTTRAFDNQRQYTKENDERIIRGLLQAIHDEVEVMWGRYQETMGSRIDTLEDDEPLNFYCPLVSDSFTVYNGNSVLIGRIPDNALRKQIIKTYMLAKGMMDLFRLNNDLVQRLETARKIYQETGAEIDKQFADSQFVKLISYANTLKQGHRNLGREINQLLSVLRTQGALSGYRNE